MRSVFLFPVLFLLCPVLWAQTPVYADKLIEYHPAPGQHINDPATGTPSVAINTINGIGNPLSLGAYGGYVVYGFSSPIQNDPDNPYGVDFIIYGNASAIHAEPGIVKVMMDLNQNGLPDETWYEIAGSAHLRDEILKDYSIRYLNPVFPVAADVSWTDGKGNKGKVYKNSFHSQPYYPHYEYFPDLPVESLSFSGSKIKGNVKYEKEVYVSRPYAFGYADNIALKNQNFTGKPDNPYTLDEIEGDGADAFDISWAVDEDGKYIDLEEISFIMIYTGVNDNAGWLGEISTDIRGITDVEPDVSIKGQQKIILPTDIPARIVLTDSAELSGMVLFSGKPVEEEEITWESLNPDVLNVSGNQVITKNPGEGIVKACLESDPSVSVLIQLWVVEPQYLLLDKQTGMIQEGDTLVIKYSLVDKSGELVSGLIPDISIENEEVSGILEIDQNQIKFNAKAEGTTRITLNIKDFPGIYAIYDLQVTKRIVPVQISFSLSNETSSILPLRNYTISKTDVLSFTDRHGQGFNPDRNFLSLADAIISVLKSEGFGTGEKSLAFRQDEYGGSGLYVWQIGINWEYTYGWGGYKKSNSYAKTWFAIVNNSVFASGFDTIEITDGDRISLHHIEDNSSSWSFTRINSDNEGVEIGTKVFFRAEKIDVTPAENNKFNVSGPFPVVNKPVQVEESVLNSSDSDPFTSYSGEFFLSFNRGGAHEISVENSEPLIVNVLFPMGINRSESIALYPNPCGDLVTIKNPGTSAGAIRIFSMDGSLKVIKVFGSGLSSLDMDLSDLDRGLYIVELITGGNSQKQKLFRL